MTKQKVLPKKTKMTIFAVLGTFVSTKNYVDFHCKYLYLEPGTVLGTAVCLWKHLEGMQNSTGTTSHCRLRT